MLKSKIVRILKICFLSSYPFFMKRVDWKYYYETFITSIIRDINIIDDAHKWRTYAVIHKNDERVICMLSKIDDDFLIRMIKQNESNLTSIRKEVLYPSSEKENVICFLALLKIIFFCNHNEDFDENLILDSFEFLGKRFKIDFGDFIFK